MISVMSAGNLGTEGPNALGSVVGEPTRPRTLVSHAQPVSRFTLSKAVMAQRGLPNGWAPFVPSSSR